MTSGTAHQVGADDQALIDAFERAWQAGEVPAIRDFLARRQGRQAGASVPNRLLWEFVILDLWHRWRRAGGLAGAAADDTVASASMSREPANDFPARPLLDDYVKAFPELGSVAQLPLDAIAEEYRARLRWDATATEASYLERFPAQAAALPTRLAEIRDEMDLTAAYEADRSQQAHVPSGSSPSSRGDAGATRVLRSDRDKLLGTRFRILRPHAKGGLGQVSVARDEELQREVALKEIQARHADNADLRARFLLEAEVTGRLEHPGIVPVYGLGHDAAGRPYYAMRFIRGDSLQEAIERFHGSGDESFTAGERSVELRKLLGRFIDVCYAVAYAHSRGVLHRDLKPGNIMLGPYGETLVVDWGFAKTVDRQEPDPELSQAPIQPAPDAGFAPTQMGRAVGTPRFMSPEQAAGRLDLLGPASDVYSLGATLYSLLTGEPPIEGKDAPEVLLNVIRGKLRPPREIKPSIPRPLEAICLKAMALKREDRYATPKELADDIEHWRADEPVSAYPEPLLARAARWGRKHKTLVAGCFGLVTAAAIALAVSTVLIKQQQLLTEAARQLADQKSIEAQRAEKRALAEARRALAAEAKANDEAQRARKSDADAQQSLYFSNIALAQQFLRDGEVREAIEALDGCPEPYRHWEWKYLRDVAGRDQKSFHADVSPTRIAFSPDSQRIAIGTSGGELLLRDDGAGGFLLRKKVHDGAVRGIAWRPDGKALATAGSDGLARIWSLPDGELLGELGGHGKPLSPALAFSQDGKLLATGGEDATVRVWDPLTGQSLHELACESLPRAVAWQANGPGLLILEEKSRVLHWDTTTGHQSDIPLSRGAWMCASADGELVATAFNGGLRVLRLGDGKPQIVFEKQGADYSLGLAMDAAGRTLVAHGIAVGLQVFDVASGAQLYRFYGPPTPLAISPDGQRVVHPHHGKFDLFPTRVHWESRGVCVPPLTGGSDEYGRTLFATKLGVYEAATGTKLIMPGGLLLPARQQFLQLGQDGRLQACDLLNGFPQRTIPVPLSAASPFAVSPDAALIATVGEHDRVYVCDLETGAQRAVLEAAGRDAHQLVFDPRETILAVSSRHGHVRVWNWSEGKLLGDFGSEHTDGNIGACAFDPSGALLATSGGRADPRLHIWRWRDGQRLHDLDGHPGGIQTLVFSSDGRRLLSGGRDGAIRLWDPIFGREVLKIDASHDWIASAQFSADEAAIISAGHREAPRFWGGLSAPLAAGQPVDLLPWLRRHGSRAAGVEAAQAVSLTSAEPNVYSVPIDAGGSYRVRGKFIRSRSGHKKTVGIVLQAGTGRTMLALDHAHRAMSGLDQIDGQGVGNPDAHVNPTNCAVTLVDGKTHSVEVEVQRQARDVAVTVQLDGQTIIRWHGPQRSLSLSRAWHGGDPRTIGLALADADLNLEQFEFTPLDGASRILEPMPDQRPSRPAGAGLVRSSETADLLPLIDLDHGAFDVAAKRVGQELQLSAAADKEGRLAVPVWPRGAYELHCEFTVSSARMSCGVVLPLSQKRVMASLVRKARHVGLGKVRDEFPDSPQNPTSTPKGRVAPGRKHQLLVRVVPAGTASEIRVVLDNEPFYSWKGSEDELSLWTAWEIPHQRMIALGCEGGMLTCHSLGLKMLSGEAWTLVPAPAAEKQ